MEVQFSVELEVVETFAWRWAAELVCGQHALEKCSGGAAGASVPSTPVEEAVMVLHLCAAVCTSER